MNNPLSRFVTPSNRITFLRQSDNEMSSNGATNATTLNRSTIFKECNFTLCGKSHSHTSVNIIYSRNVVTECT